MGSLPAAACLKPHVAVAHFAFDFGFRSQRGDRVDNEDIDGVGGDKHLRDIERLFAVIRLADEKRANVNAETLCPGGIEGVFGIDERRDAACFLGVGDDVQGKGGFAR